MHKSIEEFREQEQDEETEPTERQQTPLPAAATSPSPQMIEPKPRANSICEESSLLGDAKRIERLESIQNAAIDERATQPSETIEEQALKSEQNVPL